MSKYAELEMLANKATPGPWWIDSHGMTMMSLPGLQVVFNHPQQSVAVRNEETGNLSHWRNDWDASFIATANPKTVMELIEENKALLTALKGMTSMYGYCWDLVDGGLLCMQDNVQRFEDAHEAAQKVIDAIADEVKQ
ncbi:MAG: hypothetical protein Q7T99_16530 [Pseudomonas sp.]|nr:hypothetical protein [Pseudomonas sp.]